MICLISRQNQPRLDRTDEFSESTTYAAIVCILYYSKIEPDFFIDRTSFPNYDCFTGCKFKFMSVCFKYMNKAEIQIVSLLHGLGMLSYCFQPFVSNIINSKIHINRFKSH